MRKSILLASAVVGLALNASATVTFEWDGPNKFGGATGTLELNDTLTAVVGFDFAWPGAGITDHNDLTIAGVTVHPSGALTFNADATASGSGGIWSSPGNSENAEFDAGGNKNIVGQWLLSNNEGDNNNGTNPGTGATPTNGSTDGNARVPDGANTAIMLGAALTGLSSLRRRFAK